MRCPNQPEPRREVHLPAGKASFNAIKLPGEAGRRRLAKTLLELAERRNVQLAEFHHRLVEAAASRDLAIIQAVIETWPGV